KRPWLAAMIADATNSEPHFLNAFAAHSGFYRFAMLYKTSKTGIGAGRKMRAACQNTFFATYRQHDCHRIGAREMFGTAVRAVSLGTASAHLGFRAAAPAETK